MDTQNKTPDRESKRLRAVYFSPTGSTRKYIRSLCSGLSSTPPVEHDITLPENRENPIPAPTEDLLVLGFPVYEERVPEHVMSLLDTLQGQNTPAVLAAVYGGVGYGVSLHQAREILEKAGFTVKAAAAFVAEHSFATDAVPLEAGRPDKEDLKEAADFGRAIRSHILSQAVTTTTLPGHLSLQARVLPPGSPRLFAHPPIFISSACSLCNTCTQVCPEGAIDPRSYEANDRACTRCFACVKYCPEHARQKKYKKGPLVKTILRLHARRRKKAELFLL